MGMSAPACGLALVAVASLVLAACAPGPTSPAAPDAAPAPVTIPAPAQRGGVLHYQSAERPAHLDPLTSTGTAMNLVTRPVYEGLVGTDYRPGFDWRVDYPLRPRLAERWEQQNETTYLFFLRTGAKWHDGEEVTVEDVVWTFRWILDPKSPVVQRNLLADVQSVEQSGPASLKITTKSVAPWFLDKLQSNAAVILPKHVADRDGVESFKKKMVGTGPFKLKEYDSNKWAVYARHESYWDSGKPYLDGIVMFYGLEWSARVAAMAAKELDILNVPDKRQLDSLLAAAGGLDHTEAVIDTAVGVMPHLTKTPFDDLRVRRAFHLGMDRHGMNQVLTQGKGLIDPPGVPAVKEGWAIPPEELFRRPGFGKDKTADLAQAKQLLTEAGYPEGLKTRLTYVRSWVSAPPIVEVLQNQLAKVGVQLELQAVDTAAHNKAMGTGDYEAIFIVFQDAQLGAGGRLHEYLLTTGGLNGGKLSDPQFDALYQKVNTTLGREQQKRVWREIQDYLIDRMYIIPTVALTSYSISQPYVRDWSRSYGNHAEVYNAADIWLDPKAASARTLP